MLSPCPPSRGQPLCSVSWCQHHGGGRCTARRQGLGHRQEGLRCQAALWDLLPPRPGACPPARPWAQRSGASGRAGAGAAPSEQQGLLLEVVPLPERQAVELLHAHAEHRLELRGRQVSLQREEPQGSVSAQPRATGLTWTAWASVPSPATLSASLCCSPAGRGSARSSPGARAQRGDGTPSCLKSWARLRALSPRGAS